VLAPQTLGSPNVWFSPLFLTLGESRSKGGVLVRAREPVGRFDVGLAIDAQIRDARVLAQSA
jgi:hypothetical protein